MLINGLIPQRQIVTHQPVSGISQAEHQAASVKKHLFLDVIGIGKGEERREGEVGNVVVSFTNSCHVSERSVYKCIQHTTHHEGA